MPPVNRCCLDLDPRRGGDESWAELQRTYGPAEPAVEQLTGSGGRHLLWEQIPGLGCKNDVFPGIDLKSTGGYIVIAPSIHPDTGRRYCWEVDHHPAEHAVGPAPEWLRTLLLQRAATGPDVLAEGKSHAAISSADWMQLLSTPCETRHAAITRLVGHLLVHRVDGYAVLGIALMWNRIFARPEALPEAEVERTVRSIAVRELSRRAAWQAKEASRGRT
jgi:hypothetical protein